jgi:sporulation protein YlmC with PRC-barrel domain
MESGRYLPAARVNAGSLSLSDVSVRTNEGRELGKLAGFVIDPGAHCIRSLVLQGDSSQLELPMGHVQLDPGRRTLTVADDSSSVLKTFAAESVPEVQDEDLWVPFFHSAA